MKTYVNVALIVIAVVWYAIFLDESARDTTVEQAQISTVSRSTMPQRRPVKTYNFAAKPTPTPKLFHDVVYKVAVLQSGCHSIGTTYEMPSGTSQRDTSACGGKMSPMTIDTRTAERGDFLYLSVQNDSKYTTLACQIFVDGRLVYETKSQGEYVIASCSGRIP